MSTTQTEINDLEDLFVYNLEAVYDMEIRLVDALDDMARQASNDDLSAGFETHRDETEVQIERVESVFDALDREPNRRTNPLMDGLETEMNAFDANVGDDTLRNLHYLNGGMKTERIEITAYEGLITIAEKAGFGSDVTSPLEETLDEEERTFRKLQGLSTGSDLKTLWNKLTS